MTKINDYNSLINIFGLDFKIVHDDRIDENGNTGEIHIDKLLIRISPSIPLQQKEQTMIHEIVHAVTHFQGMEMGESDIIRLSYGLYSVFSVNRMLTFGRFFDEEKYPAKE